jgi:Flp pilus assembly protein TadG
MVAMPLLSFGAMLAVDFTKVLVLTREMSNATGAAALAGAQQYAPNSTKLEPNRATAQAIELLVKAQADGAIKGALTDRTVTVNQDLSQVSVRATYEIRDLALLPLVASLFGADGGVVRHTVTRTATVCIPDEERTGEAARLQTCTRPVR